LLRQVREHEGRSASPGLGLINSQSVKTASVTKEKGLDDNKKISGRKRFVITDTIELILAIFIAPINTGERQGAENVLCQMRGKYPRLIKVLADQGFAGEDLLEYIFSSV